MIRLSLPYPPSSNRLWRAVRGRNIKSAVYREWEKACIAAQYERCIVPLDSVHGPYTVVFTAQRPDRRRRDIGNLEKACSDILQALGVVRDDCDCQRMTIQWAPGEPVKGAAILVEITPA